MERERKGDGGREGEEGVGQIEEPGEDQYSDRQRTAVGALAKRLPSLLKRPCGRVKDGSRWRKMQHQLSQKPEMLHRKPKKRNELKKRLEKEE